MKIKLLLIFLFPFIGVAQQQSQEKIFNLYAKPVYNYNKVLSDSIMIKDSTMLINIGFKIEDIQDISKVYINIGSRVGGNETVSISYDVVYSNGTYELSNNGNTIPIFGRNIYLTYTLLIDNLSEYKYIEVWGKDKLSLLTSKTKIHL